MKKADRWRLGGLWTEVLKEIVGLEEKVEIEVKARRYAQRVCAEAGLAREQAEKEAEELREIFREASCKAELSATRVEELEQKLKLVHLLTASSPNHVEGSKRYKYRKSRPLAARSPIYYPNQSY